MSRKSEDDRNPFAAPESDLAPESFREYQTNFVYGGFWARFLASIVDAIVTIIIFGVILVIFFAIMFALQPGPEVAGIGVLAIQILFQVLGWLYYALQESSNSGATVGKQLMGLRVLDLRGQKISFGRATGRYFAKIPSSMLLMIGFLIQPFTERKQALHDILASTIVVKG